MMNLPAICIESLSRFLGIARCGLILSVRFCMFVCPKFVVSYETNRGSLALESMMRSSTKIVSAVVLLVAFILFNVGVPVVNYLCPLMSAETPFCDMSSPTPAEGYGLASQTPSCCNKTFGAERNTTPFIKGDKPIQFEKSLIQSAFHELPTIDLQAHSFAYFVSSPHLTAPLPLFILHSSLLI